MNISHQCPSLSFSLISAPCLASGLQGFSVHSSSDLRMWTPVPSVRGAHSY